MKDLLLEVEKNPFYQELLASVPKENREQFIKEVAEMAKAIDGLCSDFDVLMNSEGGPDKFLSALGSAINRRSFYGNNGVTEIPWPEKS
tara:strand:+ start:62 stop:328 length:267 start_codon:yes stop_codon:yes gene_type:complete